MKKFILPLLLIVSFTPNISFGQYIGTNLAGFTSVSAGYTTYGASAIVSDNVSAGGTITLGASATAGDLHASAFAVPGSATTGTQTTPNNVLTDQLQEIADAKTALSALATNYTPAPTMGTTTLLPGVYYYASALDITANAVITFDGGGASNPVWIFNVDAAIVVGADVTFVIINNPGNDASVIWNSGSYTTVGASTPFVGTLFAEGLVSFGAGASLPCGNVFSRTSYVSFGASANFTSSGCIGAAVALPVEMTFFIAERENNNIALTWETATEENNEGFEVQRSTDGKNWEYVDFVAGQGNTLETSNYHFIDESPIAGINYYRLKQVDFDGQFEYSNIVNIQTIESSKHQTINIYPNPVTDELTIENGQGTAIIYNAVGQSVQEVNIDASKVQLNVSELPQGIYTIHIRKTNGESITKQFVK
jgi:hypothetical protein